MLRRSLIWIVTALASCVACRDSRSERDAPAKPPRDAGGSEWDREPLALAHSDEPLPPPKPHTLDAEETQWAAAEDFTIELERTSCYGTCPIFKLSVHASGDMRFTGEHYVKPGTYDLQIAPDDAAKLYADLIARGFLRLGDNYKTAEACSGLVDDFPSSIFTLRAGGREKRIVYDQSCRPDQRDADALYAIEREIFVATGLARFLQSKLEPGCGIRFPDFRATFTASYVLRDLDDSPLGVFEVKHDSSDRIPWSVTTCDGTRLAHGTSVALWDCGYLLLPDSETTLAWPGTDEPQAAVVIAAKEWPARSFGGLANDIIVTLFRLEKETRQDGAQGTRCD